MATRIISKSFSHFSKISLFTNDDEADISELREYYSEFFQDDYFAKTKIISTKTIESLDEKYTVYVIQVRLPFTEYIIEKRYNHFHDLYKKVEKNYKNVGIGRTEFPSKRIFGSFTESTIEYRKSSLDRFLILLSEAYRQEQMVEFLEFLELKKRIEMLIRLPTAAAVPSIKQDGAETNSDIDQVTYYLNLFNRNPRDLCRSFKEFENYFFETRPKFSRQAIKLLLYGNDGELQGLIHLCGKCDSRTDSHLTCGAGLHLLVRLLDYEYNRDAELFNTIFGSTNLRDLTYLYFDKHIQVGGFRPCKVAAMKLLNNFMNQNPNLAVNQLIMEDEIRQEFEIWKISQQTTSIKAESYFKFRSVDL